jgi:uncharacterized protein
MLTVETYLAESKGKGVGLFAKKPIPKGEAWWIRNEAFDKVTDQAIVESYPPLAKTFIKNYGFLEPTGRWYLCIDNARFSNHSDLPNSMNILNDKGEILSCIAFRDILEGEEILCDYRDTCITCANNLGFDNKE